MVSSIPSGWLQNWLQKIEPKISARGRLCRALSWLRLHHPAILNPDIDPGAASAEGHVSGPCGGMPLHQDQARSLRDDRTAGRDLRLPVARACWLRSQLSPAVIIPCPRISEWESRFVSSRPAEQHHHMAHLIV